MCTQYWANLGELGRGSSEDERESSAMAQAGRAMRPRRSPSIVPVSEKVEHHGRLPRRVGKYWATGLYWAYWARRC